MWSRPPHEMVADQLALVDPALDARQAVGKLRRLAVWDGEALAPVILAALPLSIERLELRVDGIDAGEFDVVGPWRELRDAMVRLTATSRLRTLVIDAPEPAHRLELGDWLRTSGRDIDVVWEDPGRASPRGLAQADDPPGKIVAPLRIDASARAMRRWLDTAAARPTPT